MNELRDSYAFGNCGCCGEIMPLFNWPEDDICEECR